MMSQENVELSLLMLEAWTRRDVEALIALSDPEVVGSAPFEETTEGVTYRGHAGVRQYCEHLAEFSEENRFERVELYDLGDQVLGLGRIWFRFASGVELGDREGAFLLTWRNEKCIESRLFLSHAGAREAAGLRE